MVVEPSVACSSGIAGVGRSRMRIVRNYNHNVPVIFRSVCNGRPSITLWHWRQALLFEMRSILLLLEETLNFSLHFSGDVHGCLICNFRVKSRVKHGRDELISIIAFKNDGVAH